VFTTSIVFVLSYFLIHPLNFSVSFLTKIIREKEKKTRSEQKYNIKKNQGK
jgi:hypothetical protein